MGWGGLEGWDSEVEVKRLCKASSRPVSKKLPPLRVVREERVGERERRREIRGWSWTLEEIRQRRERCWEIRRGVEAISILTLRVILAAAKRVVLKWAN